MLWSANVKQLRLISETMGLAAHRWPILLTAVFLNASCGVSDGRTDSDSVGETLSDTAEDAVTIEARRQHLAHDPIGEALERSRREFSGVYLEPLPEFAAKCDLATGVHVPDFNCSAGTLVPTTNAVGTYPNMTCDRPNRLNQECDPGSRFQVLANLNNSVIVAHCRKTGLPGNLYSDIAVIQYNKVSGAVCFYQALDDSGAGFDGNFKAPSLGTSLASEAATPNPVASPWLSNFRTKDIDCHRCHDNGAIIRSPYLAQLTALPGAGDNTYNKTNPVSFIGNDYQGLHTYSVQLSGSLCNACHRMGVSDAFGEQGTSRDFGLRATGPDGTEMQKNIHSASSPIWMTPGQITYSAANDAAAHSIKTCADAISAHGVLPSGCTTSEITRPFHGLAPASLSVIHSPLL